MQLLLPFLVPQAEEDDDLGGGLPMSEEDGPEGDLFADGGEAQQVRGRVTGGAGCCVEGAWSIRGVRQVLRGRQA